MDEKDTSDYINLSNLSKALIVHGISLIAVSLFDLGCFLCFFVMTIIESNSGKYTGEAGWGLLALWIVLILLLPIALIALYYLIRGIRFIRTGNRRIHKNTLLDSKYLKKVQHSAILQMVLLSLEIIYPLVFALLGWLKYVNFNIIIYLFVIFHIGLLLESFYFHAQLHPSKR